MESPGIRRAASVVLVRERDGTVEVLLAGRPQSASFVPGSWVFPGGGAEAGEELRRCAVRELLEECGLRVAEAALVPFARWITPSIEPKRFDAQFFLAAAPAALDPVIDEHEVTAALWITPLDALAARARLRLMPPQVHILTELGVHGGSGVAGLVAWARAERPFPILPRLAQTTGGPALLLPWDPDYETLGTGDARPLAPSTPRPSGPSRCVLGPDGGWQIVAA